MEQVVLTSVNVNSLIENIAHRTAQIMQSLIKPQPETSEPDELLSRKEALKLLKVSASTLWHWEQDGKIQSHGIGGKKYYKRSEILNSLTVKK